MPAWSVPAAAPSLSASVGGNKSGDAGNAVKQTKPGLGERLWRVVTLGGRVDVRLVLETGWFVVVNVGTMYMFLFRGFYWRGEDGGLDDGGRVQRFMW